jgi:hypothetical protein
MSTPLSLPPPSVALFALFALGCPRHDVGAPCNHGALEPPRTPTVTFPALSCDQLLCVYASSDEPPVTPCGSAADCNAIGAPDRFECLDGACEVAATHVLSRSMCSRRCDSDADCEGGDLGTACETGFRCARIQSLGDLCCEKLCVCRDDLDEISAVMREDACATGRLEGCCDRDPVPDGCGQ